MTDPAPAPEVKPEVTPTEPAPLDDGTYPEAPPEESPVEVAKKEKEECLKKAMAIIAMHGGTESNVPIASDYWELMNRYRAK